MSDPQDAGTQFDVPEPDPIYGVGGTPVEPVPTIDAEDIQRTEEIAAIVAGLTQ